MKEIKMDKYRGSFILKFAVLCFAVFIVYSLVTQQVKIHQKQEELTALKTQLKTQQLKNDEAQKALENAGNLADYAERSARRDFDYAKPEERIFVDVDGSD